MYILFALLIFGVLIFIHELGHFIVARLCGVEILEFSIGMGPKLISWKSKKNGTKYSLRLFPIGGYVSMLGENGMEAVQGDSTGKEKDNGDLLINEAEASEEESPKTAPMDPERAKHAYCNQNVWKRILISVAGPAMNLLLGFLLMLVVVLCNGQKSAGTNVIDGFYVEFYAQESYMGIQKDDLIIALQTPEDIENKSLHTIRSLARFQELVAQYENESFTVYVQRAGESAAVKLENVVLHTELIEQSIRGSVMEAAGLKENDMIVKVNNTSVHTAHELVYELGNQGHKPLSLTVVRDGVELEPFENVSLRKFTDSGAEFGTMDFFIKVEESFGVGTVLKHTWYRSISSVKMVFDSVSGLFSGRYGLQAVSGPIGVTKVISDTAQTGLINVLFLITLISINLGVMNLLPIPALDGGHLLLYIIEVIRRKPVKPEVEGIINFVGLVLMLALAVVIAIKDIIAL